MAAQVDPQITVMAARAARRRGREGMGGRVEAVAQRSTVEESFRAGVLPVYGLRVESIPRALA
jgi:hypothetical protein